MFIYDNRNSRTRRKVMYGFAGYGTPSGYCQRKYGKLPTHDAERKYDKSFIASARGYTPGNGKHIGSRKRITLMNHMRQVSRLCSR